MIPVSVITGFLGSGKTTVLSNLLRDPGMGRPAVIINEFGAVALDHDLIETSDETVVTLANGCLCCRVESDLVLTLQDLLARRAAGSVPPFDRVIIETSGLADPAPVLHVLMTDPRLADAYALDRVIATVDALVGLRTLAVHDECVRQVVVADRILLTKTDVCPGGWSALEQRLHALNAGAPVVAVIHGAISAAALFDHAPRQRTRTDPDFEAWLGGLARDPAFRSAHGGGVTSICLTRAEPVHASALSLFLSALAENCGSDLLRFKALVAVTGRAGPAVLHGVQHVYSEPVWLPRWPSDDRRTRMVFIGRNLRESWIRALLELIEEEVADEARGALVSRRRPERACSAAGQGVARHPSPR
jgi:G3E family GTPase